MAEKQRLDKLDAWMEKERWTQVQFAREIGLDSNYIGMILRCERPATAGFRLAFAARFGYDLMMEVLGNDTPRPSDLTIHKSPVNAVPA